MSNERGNFGGFSTARGRNRWGYKNPFLYPPKIIDSSKIVSLSADKITAGTIDASSITVKNLNADNITAGLMRVAYLDNVGPILNGFTWTDNSPGAGSVAWSSGALIYNGTQYIIGMNSTTNQYIYWPNAATYFLSSATFPVLGSGDFIIATNTSGTSRVLRNPIASDNLGADIALAANPTWTNIVTFPLTPGTWIVIGQYVIKTTTAPTTVNTRIWDGTTAFAPASGGMGTLDYFTIPLLYVLKTSALSTTVTMQANTTAGAATAKFQGDAAVPAITTYMFAVRIG